MTHKKLTQNICNQGLEILKTKQLKFRPMKKKINKKVLLYLNY